MNLIVIYFKIHSYWLNAFVYSLIFKWDFKYFFFVTFFFNILFYIIFFLHVNSIFFIITSIGKCLLFFLMFCLFSHSYTWCFFKKTCIYYYCCEKKSEKRKKKVRKKMESYVIWQNWNSVIIFFFGKCSTISLTGNFLLA